MREKEEEKGRRKKGKGRRKREVGREEREEWKGKNEKAEEKRKEGKNRCGVIDELHSSSLTPSLSFILKLSIIPSLLQSVSFSSTLVLSPCISLLFIFLSPPLMHFLSAFQTLSITLICLPLQLLALHHSSEEWRGGPKNLPRKLP